MSQVEMAIRIARMRRVEHHVEWTSLTLMAVCADNRDWEFQKYGR
jgi:hypothetical protein